MATVSQVTEAVYQGRFQDQMSAGADAATKAMDKLGASVEAVDERVTRAERSAKTWVNQLDPVTSAANRVEKAQRALAQAQKALAEEFAAGGDRAAAAGRTIDALEAKVSTAKTRYDALRSAGAGAAKGMDEVSEAAAKATNAFGLAGYQVRNLTAQVVDFTVQVASGGGLFYPIIQQGPQAVDAVGGVRSALSILGQILTPTRLLIGGVTTALVASAIAGESQERALNSISTRLRATRSDYLSLTQTIESNARAIAGSSGMSTDDARQAGTILASTKGFSGTAADLEKLTRTSEAVALMLGTTVPAAAEKMAAGLRRPAEVARQLADQDLRTLDDATLRSIESLENLGKRSEAGSLLMEALARAAGSARDAQTPFQRSLSDLGAAATRAWNLIQPIVTGIGTQLVGGIASAISGIVSLIEKVQGLGSAFADSAIGRFLLDPNHPAAQWLNRQTGGFGFAPSTAPLSNDASQSEIRARVIAEAQAANVPIDFAQRIAGQESQFRQLGANGRILTSSAGALGVMQIMPATAAGLGIDATDINQNIAGGIKLLAQLLQRYGGDQSLAAAAYNAGPRRVDDALAGRGTLPSETWEYVRRTGGTGGRLSGSAETVSVADDRARSAGVLSDKIRQQQERIAQTEAALATPGLDTDRQTRYLELLRQQRAELDALRTPEQKRTEQFQDQVRVMAAAEGGARALMQAEVDEIRAAQSEGRSPDVATARARAQELLNRQVQDTVNQIGLETAAQELRNQAALKSVAETQKQEIATKAYKEALKSGAEGTAEFEQNLQLLTRAYTQQQQAANAAALIPSIKEMEQGNEQLKLQTSLITASTAERERALALAQAEKQIRDANADGTPEATRLRAAAEASASLRVENQQLTNSWQELQNFGTQAFDRIGSAITEAFVNGKESAVTFASVSKALLSEVIQLMLKMAVINPLQNAVFGTNLGTLSGAASVIGGASSGTSGGLGGLSGISSLLSFSKLSSTVSGWLSTPLWSIGNQSAATTSALSSMGGVYGPATPSAVSAAGYSTTSIGSLLGGAGLGFGAGSLLNTLARGNSTGGTVGSAAGGLAGAAIGSIVPGVGTVLGGLIGGAGGGLLGGPFGGGKGFSGGTIQVEVQDGQLVVAGTRSKGKADSSEAVAALQQQVTTLNTALSQRGLYLNAAGLVTEQGFGQDKRAADVAGVARSYLASDDPTIQTIIRNSLGSSLEAVLSDVDWAKSVYQPMVDAAKTSAVDASEFFVNLRAQTDPLNAAIDKAKELGLATDDLAESLQKTTDAAYAARDATVLDIRQGLVSRSNAATGNNSLQAQLDAAKYAGDVQVKQLETQLQSLDFTPGDANGRYGEVNQLIAVLEQERTALVQQYTMQRAANDNSLWDRYQSATGNGDTLEGARWDYERKAVLEWQQAVADGMTDLTLLAQTQAEERLQIERNYAEKAEALRQETLQSELSALQTLKSQSDVLTGWLDSQKLSSSLNSPSAALAEAQRQFSTAMDAARTAGPGQADLSAVTSAASSVISAGSAYYGTSSGQAALEAMVRQSITSLGAQLDLPAFTDDVVGAVARLQAAQETGTATLAAKLDAIYAELRTQRLQRAA
ncbi:transglycosylase SLT domain-containing protein [Roseomonas mucosa]|uniref:phage tail length tape measure family protein n=1 Tax=Roseomonas mucosa TaxID=207340 RepID=UPI0030CAD251